VKTLGEKRECVHGFVRSKQECQALIAVPRFFTKLSEKGTLPVGQMVWGDGRILLPEGAPKNWLSVLTGDNIKASAGESTLCTKILFSHLPIGPACFMYIRNREIA
jgi:maltooligosyltrehalose synthase